MFIILILCFSKTYSLIIWFVRQKIHYHNKYSVELSIIFLKQAIGQKYSEWSEVVPVTFVKFEEESIKIDISADNAGWTAVCLSPNKV